MRPLLTLAVLLCAAASALGAPAAPVNPMDWVGPTTYSAIYPDAKLSADGKTAILGSFTDEYVVLRLADKQIIARYLPEATAENVTATSSRGRSDSAMAISSHGEWVAMCTHTGIYVYSTTGTRSPQLIPSDCPIVSMLFPLNSSKLVVSYEDGLLSEFDVVTGKPTRSKQTGYPLTSLVALPECGKWAGITGYDTMVLISADELNVQTYTVVDEDDRHYTQSSVGEYIGYNALTKEIVAAIPSGFLARWKADGFKPVLPFKRLTDEVKGVSPKGVVVTGKDFKLAFRDNELKPISVTTPPNLSPRYVRFSGNGDLMLVPEAPLQAVSMATGKIVFSISETPDGGFSKLVTLPAALVSKKEINYPHASFSQVFNDVFQMSTSGSDGESSSDNTLMVGVGGANYLYVDSKNSELMTYSIEPQKLLGTFKFDRFFRQITINSMSYDGRYFAFRDAASSFLWNVQLHKDELLPKPLSIIDMMVVSPNGKMVAMGGYDMPPAPIDAYGRGSTLFLAEPGSNKFKQKLFPHQGRVIVTQFNIAGNRLISLDEAKTLRIWDLSTGKPLRTLLQAGINAIYCADDRRILVQVDSISYDLYDASSAKRLARIWQPAGDTVIISSDGRYDGSAELLKQLWVLGNGQVGYIKDQGLKYTPNLSKELVKWLD